MDVEIEHNYRVQRRLKPFRHGKTHERGDTDVTRSFFGDVLPAEALVKHVLHTRTGASDIPT